MKFTSLDQFNNSYNTARLQPVSVQILGDLDTPVTTFLKATHPPYRFLLESAEGGAQRGRFSIIGDDPLAVFTCKNGISSLENKQSGEITHYTDNPLSVIKDLLNKYTLPGSHDSPFNCGGLYGYLGYDTIRYIETLPDLSVDDMNIPDMVLFIPQNIIVFDNLYNKITITRLVTPDGKIAQEYNDAREKIQQTISLLQNPHLPGNGRSVGKSNGALQSNMDKTGFKEIVTKTQEYIKKGDIFQGVLSQRFSLSINTPAFDIYRALRVINPSPYMFFLQMDDLVALGSSPETLVKIENNKVYVKPIAGTRKRGVNDKEDEALINELLADPKERAEHTMLVDLGRNDIGKIAEYGSVKVEELMTIEKYSHVIHIVSTVSGVLKKGLDALDVYQACFPAGTVSGTPKIRAMEIIEELEPTRRGIYAGAAGYFSFDGNMDVCIAIRTIYVKNNQAWFQAGAGIVADSVPEKEYEETLNKAKGLEQAIKFAEGGLYDTGY